MADRGTTRTEHGWKPETNPNSRIMDLGEIKGANTPGKNRLMLSSERAAQETVDAIRSEYPNVK